MENPRHTTQVGLPRGNRRIFLEDYVISYMKQHKSDTTVKTALYGYTKKEDNTTKFFVFGAACIYDEPYAAEWERVRRVYFPEYQYIGYGELGTELPDGFYVETENGTSYIEGYYCFYEDNDSMLGYMVEEREDAKKTISTKKDSAERRKEELSDVPELTMTERISAREYRQIAAQKKHRPVNKLKLSVVITFLIMCAVTIRDYVSEYREEKDSTTQVVTESNLVDALQQENQPKAFEEQVSDGDEVETTEVSSASVEVVEREPVVFEEVLEVQPEEPQTQESYHIVKQGDTLTTISILYYGNKEQVNAICQANNITKPDNIKTGQKLLLP